ncbi:hypothetical protein PHYBOEH_011105 [Phytophthora boehmeriae]|uniref:Uncharacterized protein n=1 Tax=Phytophthora boehmeriae TaxID=109152 RepID=A0A8T1VMK8_9STRA|nr:hypothetical protein PHYBOEH_011105 [Phytophthora boehmeriae]
MYKSAFDASGALEIAFDPLRPFHAHEDSRLEWPEYPYKQVTIDRVRTKAGKSARDGSGLSEEAAAERRFRDERLAFRQAKRDFIRSEKAKVKGVLDAQTSRKRKEQEERDFAVWKARQIVKRYEDGSKYDGDGVTINDVLVPHGFGTLRVPEERYITSVGRGADIKRVIRISTDSPLEALSSVEPTDVPPKVIPL